MSSLLEKTFYTVAIVIVIATGLIANHNMRKDTKKLGEVLKRSVYNDIEKAYAEGQKDYKNGIIRYDVINNCWLCSPWDDNRVPTGCIKLCTNTHLIQK